MLFLSVIIQLNGRHSSLSLFNVYMLKYAKQVKYKLQLSSIRLGHLDTLDGIDRKIVQNNTLPLNQSPYS